MSKSKHTENNSKILKYTLGGDFMQWGVLGFVATLGILCIVEGICNADFC